MNRMVWKIEHRDQTLMWDDNVLNSIIHHQVLMMILLVILLICIAAAIFCWCRCFGYCCCFLCGFYQPRRWMDRAKNYVATNPPGVGHENNSYNWSFQYTLKFSPDLINYGIGYRVCHITGHVAEILRYNEKKMKIGKRMTICI